MIINNKNIDYYCLKKHLFRILDQAIMFNPPKNKAEDYSPHVNPIDLILTDPTPAKTNKEKSVRLIIKRK